MGRTVAIITIFAALCLDASVNARILDAPAPPDANGGARGDGPAQARKARRSRARKRRAAAAHTPAGNGNASPASQPAHMAPQLEDIPPVKPPKKTPPPADKRNPGQ